VTCHNPHKRAAVSVKTKCETCHSKQAADFKGSRMEKSGVFTRKGIPFLLKSGYDPVAASPAESYPG